MLSHNNNNNNNNKTRGKGLRCRVSCSRVATGNIPTKVGVLSVSGCRDCHLSFRRGSVRRRRDVCRPRWRLDYYQHRTMEKKGEEARVSCETTKGPVVMRMHRDWSPNGYDRVVDLFERVSHHIVRPSRRNTHPAVSSSQ